MNHFRSNNNSLKFQRFTPSGCKDIEIMRQKFSFFKVADNQEFQKKN